MHEEAEAALQIYRYIWFDLRLSHLSHLYDQERSCVRAFWVLGGHASSSGIGLSVVVNACF